MERERLTDTEEKLVVARGEMGRGGVQLLSLK